MFFNFTFSQCSYSNTKSNQSFRCFYTQPEGETRSTCLPHNSSEERSSRKNINFPLRNPALKSLQLTCAIQAIRAFRTKQIALSFIRPATLLGHILNGGAHGELAGALYQVFLVPITAKLSGHRLQRSYLASDDTCCPGLVWSGLEWTGMVSSAYTQCVANETLLSGFRYQMTANSISSPGAKLIRLANQQVCLWRKAVILTFPIVNEIFNGGCCPYILQLPIS